MTQTVFETTTGATPLSGIPPLEHQIESGQLRLIVLPPGRIDAQFSMDRNLIDVNLNPVDHHMSVNADKRRSRPIPSESIAFWPTLTDVGIASENTLPGCVVEVGDRTMHRWLGEAGLSARPIEFVHYRHDPVAADLGRAAIRYLLQAQRMAHVANRLTVEALALGIAARVMALLEAGDGDTAAITESWRKRGDARWIRLAIDWAEAHLTDPGLSIGDMAAAASLSPSHFGAVFRAATGESVYAFILRRRAEFARDLVIGTQIPLSEVAYTSGFSNQAHMTTVLKRLFGSPPGKMRRN